MNIPYFTKRKSRNEQKLVEGHIRLESMKSKQLSVMELKAVKFDEKMNSMLCPFIKAGSDNKEENCTSLCVHFVSSRVCWNWMREEDEIDWCILEKGDEYRPQFYYVVPCECKLWRT